jgi:hypothetical protein
MSDQLSQSNANISVDHSFDRLRCLIASSREIQQSGSDQDDIQALDNNASLAQNNMETDPLEPDQQPPWLLDFAQQFCQFAIERRQAEAVRTISTLRPPPA